MSKVLIDRDVLESIADYADKTYYIDLNYDDWEVKKIREALKEAEQKHYSVLEWHPVTERPSKEKPILVKYKDHNKTYYLCDIAEINSFFESDNAKEWACLPE